MPSTPSTRPVTERSEFRLWTTVVTFTALAGLVVAVLALARSDGSGASALVEEQPEAPASIDLSGTPAEDWTARDPAAPPVPASTVHRVTLQATETELEVAPGVTQTMWTFGAQVPGPTLRGRVGDVFEVTLVNDGSMGHSIDFHASEVAPNVEMRTIGPGESLLYRFEAEQAGAFLYHCGTPPVLHHVGNGMYGAIIIDPPDLPPVDHELVLVQSEIYAAPPGEVASLEAMLDKDWDAVVFNGFANQYQHRPIEVDPGQRVRIWVVDAGPSEPTSFHVIGTIFDTVFEEGRYVLRPDATRGGSQALDLGPAQGGFVETTFATAGVYPFLTHDLADASRGALGLFRVGGVTTEGGPGH